MESCGGSGVALLMIKRLKLSWWHVTDGAVQSPVVPPVDPPGGRQFDLLERPPGATRADKLGFVQAVDGFRERVVIRVSA